MPKIIDADELTIKALLDISSNAYSVPNHQRQFEWSKEQWNDLWDDINLGDIDEGHFLGSIVVIPNGRPQVSINYFEINDGQQRLTTITILLSVIRDCAKKLGNEDFAKYISEHYLFSNYFEGGVRKEVPKLKLGKLDDEQIRNVFLGRLQDGKRDDVHRIYECYNFFNSKIQDFNLEQLEELTRRVVDKVIIVHINVADKLNAFRLFETLNDRGLALSAVDLIKNHLLMRASVDGNDTTVDSIVEEWIEMYEKIRNYDPVIFFYRFMLSEYPGKVSARQLYEEITQKARNWGAKDIVEFTKKLNQAATIYTEIIDGKTGNLRVDRRLQDIKLFEAGPSYTLLLKITPLFKSGAITEEQYLKVIDFIEAFHIRWGICGQSTSRLNDIYNQMCTRLDLNDLKEIVLHIEINFLSWASSVNDSAFNLAFKEEFAQFSASRTKYILWKLGKPAGEVSLNFDEVHTEHILPQTLSSGWISELEKATDMNKEQIQRTHDLLINKIGNFALIKGEWNISMSNRVFNEKKESYIKSEIQPTQELADRHEWTFNDIVERTDNLSVLATQIWKFDNPIPDANVEVKTLTKKYPVADSVKLICKAQNVSATAYIINESKMRVEKGSHARKEIVPSFKDHSYFKLREQLLNEDILVDNGDSLVFKQDYDFDSLSAAGSVVLGMSSNGQNDWKNEDGTPICELIEGDVKTSSEKNVKIIDDEKYPSFYGDLVKRMEVLLPGKYKEPRASGNYYQIPTGFGSVHFEWVSRKNGFGVELHFEKDKDFNKEMIEKIENIDGIKEKLEQLLGEEVVFEKDRKWTKICVEKKDAKTIEELKDWAVNKMKIFIEILQPELDKIL